MVLGIYGAGGLGQEVLTLAIQINMANNVWDKFVFIDDNPDIAPVIKDVTVLKFDEYCIKYDTNQSEICVAVGEPFVRELIAKRICERFYSLAILVYPGVYVSESIEIGDGTIIHNGVSLSCDICIGKNVYIQPHAVIGHDNVIGNNSVISTFVVIGGNCHIGSNAYIGLHVPIKEGLTIGNNSIVGMGAVVCRDIPDNVIALGNPARPMKNNESKRVFSS